MSHRKQIKTLHLIETGGPGGAENVLINLVSGLDREKFHSIVCLRKKGWLYDELSMRGIETHIVSEHGLFDIAFLVKLVILILQNKITIIHSHEFLMNVYGTIAGTLSGTPVVTTIHGKYYYWEKWRRRVAMRLVSRLSRLIVVSEELRQFIYEKVGINPKRIQNIYNGIDVQKYGKSSRTSSLKKELGIDDQTKVIGTVGNLYVVKGQLYLIQAMPAILKKYPDTVLLIAGRGNQEDILRKESIKLGISDQIRLLGFRNDVPDILAILDVFVLPSLAESLPLSVLEAMATGLPSVVTDVGGNREIIEEQRTGFIVHPADSHALAEKIAFLLNNKENADQIGIQAREIIIKKFSLNVMLSHYEALYLSLT